MRRKDNLINVGWFFNYYKRIVGDEHDTRHHYHDSSSHHDNERFRCTADAVGPMRRYWLEWRNNSK
jgi:hypothetical protein